MFKRFIREKNGNVIEYVLVMCLVSTIIVALFPGLRGFIANTASNMIQNIDRSIVDGGTGTNTGGGNNPDPSNGGSTAVPPEENNNAGETDEGKEEEQTKPPEPIEPPRENIKLCGVTDSEKVKTNQPVGSGDSGSPYQISNIKEMQWLNHLADETGDSCYAELTSNIDASETKNWNNGEGFDPLMDGSIYVYLNVDGKNHTISNLYINRPNEYGVGLFSGINGTISNLKITNANITGNQMVGILAGDMSSREVNNIEISGNVKGETAVGGLAGEAQSSVINRVRGKVNVETTDWQIGGLAGEGSGEISNIKLDATLQSDGEFLNGAGGLFGILTHESTITDVQINSVFKGVEINSSGALIGILNESLTLENAAIQLQAQTGDYPYAKGILIGNSEEGMTVNLKDAYLYSNIDIDFKDTEKLHIIGDDNQIEINETNFYYNNDNPLYEKVNYGTGIPTNTMKTTSTYKGFDFSSKWAIGPRNNGFPYIRSVEF